MPAPEAPPPIAYRIDDAARAAGLSRSKLYALIAEGALRAVRRGGRTLVLHAELEAFLRGAD